MDLLPNEENMLYATQASNAENAGWEGKGNVSAVREGKIVTVSITNEEISKDDYSGARESISRAEEEEIHWVKIQRRDGDWEWDREEDEGEWVDSSSDEEEDGSVEMHKEVDESYRREDESHRREDESHRREDESHRREDESHRTEDESHRREGGVESAQHEPNTHGCPGFPSDADEGSDKWIHSTGSSVLPLAEGSSDDSSARATAQIGEHATPPYTSVNVSVVTGYGLGRLVRVIDEVLRTRGG